jgi:pantothenate kinase type III
VRYAIDLGNSAAKVGYLREGALVSLRVATPANPRDAGAWRAVAEALLDLAASEGGAATELVVGSVVPDGTAAERTIAVDVLRSGDLPLVSRLEEPDRIGVDRALAAWFTYAQHGVPNQRGAIAVTLGTALTLTCVSRAGELLGGAIAASPLLAARALASGTAALPEVTLYDESSEIPGPIGASTESALAAGILRSTRGGLTALIEESVAEMERRNPGSPAPAISLTGGAATAGWSARIRADLRDPDLVVRALLALPRSVRT